MPFNGAGVYSLPAGSIVADGTTIDAADHNTPIQDIESALSATTLRNGATPFTGNQSFSGNKITSLGDGTAATDAATLKQAQSGVNSHATAVGGTGNATTLTFAPPFTAYTNGMQIRWVAGSANTASMTINVDGLGAKTLRKDASGTLANLASGDMVAGMFVEATYNSANDCFVWVNQKPVFVNGNGDVGIGVSSPQNKLHVDGTVQIDGLTSRLYFYNQNNVLTAELGIPVLTGFGDSFGITTRSSTGVLALGTNQLDRLRINSDGDILVGTSTLWDNARAVFSSVGRGNNVNVMSLVAGGTSSTNQITFRNGNGVIGTISTNVSTTFYNTSSDYRLKENVHPLTGALSRLSQLKPSRFTFKADPGCIVDGFIAHEAQTVVPEAVTGKKDAVKEDGTPDYQAIDHSKLVPLLTAALQELKAELDALKAKVG